MAGCHPSFGPVVKQHTMTGTQVEQNCLPHSQELKESEEGAKVPQPLSKAS